MVLYQDFGGVFWLFVFLLGACKEVRSRSWHRHERGNQRTPNAVGSNVAGHFPN